jgi:NADPH-dependent ferric siderophore reductase
VLPSWSGNLWTLPDGRRAVVRTVTPLAAGDGELAIDVVLHGPGALATWAATAAVGTRTAVSGPARGHVVDDTAAAYVVAGDETALAAIGQLLASLRHGLPATVHVELAAADGQVALPSRAGTEVRWHLLRQGARPGDALVAAVTEGPVPPGAHVWAAGEAAAVQRIRRHLFDGLGLPRSRTTVRGYWQVGRGEGDAATDGNVAASDGRRRP